MSDPAIQPAFTSGESSPDYTVIDSKPGSPVSSDQSTSHDTSPKADVTQNLLDFPTQSWTTLNSCLNMVKWVVPVLPDSHLEILLKAAIELAKQDTPTKNKTEHDPPTLKEFAILPDSKRPAPILKDFIDLFGRLNGFERLRDRFLRFAELNDMTLCLIATYLYPFSLCCDYLHPDTITEYFVPIIDIVVPHIVNITEQGMKKDSKLDIKTDSLADLGFYLRSFLLHMPEKNDFLEKVDLCCLNLILRYLQFPSFNKRMMALNDLNSLFSRLSPSGIPSQSSYSPSSDTLTIDRIATWMHDKQVLGLMLRENLHQLQYVEKAERIIRFMVKHAYLTTADLDQIWEAQDGKHQTIAKNVFDMLARLALEFTPEQLDHLFHRFQQSWSHATKRQREHLIDLICRLAEEDRDGLMAAKVLNLLWELAVDADSSPDISSFALKAHAKILDHNISEVGSNIRSKWITRLIGILKGGPREPHLLPAIRQFTEILNLIPAKQYSSHTSYLARMKTIQELNARHSLLESIVNNVVVCMMTIREQRIANADAADADVSRTPIRRISLQVEVRELLELVRFLLFEGSFIFPIDWMIRIWRGMLLRSPEEDPQTTVTPEDRELCYQWFGSLPPATIPAKNYGIFFDECILRVDPSHLTASGMMLFKIFFYQVNYQLGYLLGPGAGNSSAGNSGLTSSVDLQFLTDNADLCGLDNIWRILLDAPSSVALEAMQLLEKVYTNLSPQLLPQKRERHEDLLQHCFSRLRADYDTIHILMNTESHTTDSEMTRALDRVVRVIHLLQHFLVFDEELAHPSPKRTPLKRAWVGTSIRFNVVFYSSLSDFRGSTYHGDGFIAPRTTSPVHENDSIDQFRDVSQHTIQFTAHANMTIGELRSHLLAFRLRSLHNHINCLPQQEAGSATATSAFSGDNPTGYEDHSYKLELYVSRLEDRRPPASSVSPLLSGVPIDSSSNDSSVLILLSQFPEWPHAFMDAQEDVNLADLSRDFDDSSPRLQLVAHIVLGTPELSHLRNRKRNMEVTTRVDTSKPVTDDFLHRSCTDSAVFSEDTQCENEPQLDSVIASPSSYEDLDPVTSEQRCKFLLQLAKMAVRVNNPTFFSGVMEVLLSLPAPKSLMERIRSDVHASSASIPDADNLKTELTDWVTVQTADHTAFKGSYLGQLLTSTMGSSSTQSSVDSLDHLVDLYYTLQLLYSLCLPSPAVTQYQDYLASANQDLLTRLSLGDLTNLPVWRDASQFTLQLLRAGVIPLLLSCLALLNQTHASPVSPDSVQSTVSRLIEIWLTRMLNLLLTVVAFTVVCLARSSEQPSSIQLDASHADFEDHFTKRFQIFCAARKKALQQNDPILTGEYYVVRHAEFVGHLAKNSGVTTAEVQTRWLPDPKSSDETISLHTFPWSTNDSCISPLQNDACSQNFAIAETKESGIDCTVRESNIERRDIPKVAQTSLDGVNCSECRPSSFSLSNTSGSNVGSSERNSETDLTKQILQAFRTGDTVGMLAVESLCCVPYCIAFFPQSPLAKPIVGLSAPGSSDSLTWTQFVQELLFSRSPLLRHLTVFNLYQSVILPPVPVSSSTDAEWSVNPAVQLVRLLFSFHSTLVPKHVAHVDQYFRLVALLLRHIHEHGIPFEEATDHLIQEVNWLRTTIASRKSQDKRPNSELSSLQSVHPAPGDTDCPPSRNTSDQLLCGHMRICSALLAFPCITETPDSPTSSKTSSPVSPMLVGYTAFQKQYLTPLITDILQSLLFPAREQDDMTPSTTCAGFLSDSSLNSVFELLLALAKRDPSAVHLLSSKLCRSCFPDDFELSTYPWDYTPPPIYSSASKTSHFVGLRNGGATCYMNAILQQLFSLIPIRNAVLCARPELRLNEENVLGSKESDVLLIEAAKISPPASTDSPTDPTSGDAEKPESEVRTQKSSEERKPLTGEQTHQLRLLFHLQSIFGHLNHSLLKSYRPTEFWHEFRFVSEQVKLSEQQDALEFLQTLGNDVDESLHLCNMSKAVEEVLGGTFADQKICIDCPHRYSRNESFTTLNVDIRNHQNLLQSLEQYVKGDRLEGDNAYWCENCNKKVTTLKRMCIDRLPKVLAIQLKRFDYDWDSSSAITKELSITPRLKKMVNRENVDYLHQQMQFHPLLSRFLASLTGATLDTCSVSSESIPSLTVKPDVVDIRAKPAVSEDLALTTLKLLVNYSFTVRFQNVARDWQLWIPLLLRLVALHPVVREKFLQWTLFSSPDRVCELLFECPYPEVRFLFAILIVYIAQFKSSTLCQTSLDCLKSFEETRDSYFNNPKLPDPANTDASLAARAESAREILGSLICSTDDTQCEKPSLTDLLLQVVILQLRASPAEFIKRDLTSSKQVNLSDQYGDAGYQSSIQARALCGSSYSRAYRDLSHHPHTWNQYFSIFLDYVNSGEAARLRLLRLGFVEVVLGSAMKNQHVFTPSTLPHSLPSISSAGIRTPEVLKRQFIRILADLPDYLNSEPNQLLTNEPLCPLFSVSLESFVLALTSPYSSYSTLYNYGTNSSSGTSSAVTAGTTNLWSVLSLLIRSMDVSPYCRVHTHSSPNSKLPSPASSSEQTTTATSTTANEDVKFVDDSSDMVASQPSYQNNPYGVGRAALAPISNQLADIIFRPRSNQPMSFFLRFWLNSATLDHVTNTLLFLAYENLDFSKLTLDWIVWGINSCQTDVALLLSLLQSLLTISDSHKANRLRWALGKFYHSSSLLSITDADRTGLTSSRPENHYRQSFTHYSRAIKMFMELILDDPVVLQFFQEDDIALDWLRQWIEAIADSMRASASISQAHWLSPGSQPTQAQDAFMSLVQQVYTVLPLSDDEQSESEGVEYEESGDQMEF
ncbi:ubiquitinyl hydrolase 1 [Opisthorchis viverrini]|uniref:ubiquitinyl hydrolase 1 n=1 Tax=Opisthorchis viverrini TaxID=6198 RepID=A0A1S8X3J9_OPIVI|nr:ubiquitinyl hydrolase 1 [Opisthorchis viverrini]